MIEKNSGIYENSNFADNYYEKSNFPVNEQIKNLEQQLINKEELFKNKIKEINKLQISNLIKEVFHFF